MCLGLPWIPSLFADIAILGKKRMVQEADLIALVQIQKLVTTDKTKLVADLLATAQVSRLFKGDAKGETTFRIPRFFPCAAFDVSTGKHLVFLKRDEKDGHVGFNWYMSYVYLGGEVVKWYDEDGRVVEGATAEKVIAEVEAALKESPNKPDRPDG